MENKNLTTGGELIEQTPTAKTPLKLNTSQTIKVGFAFAIIMLFWTAYDFVVPLLLERAYGLSNAMRGLVMGLDNLLSLFMLPFFGKLSDKGAGKLAKKMGRRTPFIIVGTVLSVALMVFVPLAAKSQLVRSEEIRVREFDIIMESDEAQAELYGMFYDEAKAGNSKYCDLNYLELNDINTREDYIAIRYYPEPSDDAELTEEQQKSNDNYKKFVETGVNVFLSEKVNTAVLGTAEGKQSIIVYMIILLFVLIAMATFRSPAVALMPDVTPKPLRSQGNAIINLAGGAGAAIAFIIYTVAFFFESINTFIIIFATVGAGMLLLLAGFLSLVNEKKMVAGCERICKEYGIADDDEDDDATDRADEASATVSADMNVAVLDEVDSDSASDTALTAADIVDEDADRRKKLEKAKRVSFLLILASIFMWFMGYNAVSSSLSIYCTKALNLSASIASVISGVSMAVSAIAFIPVGFLAVKIGRKKSIMLGFALATLSFILLFAIVRPNSNQLIPSIFFSLFYLISGFGLIIANVNTFPMVVELSKAEDVGKYTGYYYTATMSAQAITPFIAGLVMDGINMYALFAYSAICVAIAIVLMFFVKHGDSKQIPTEKLSKEAKKQILLDSMGDAD